MKQTPSSVYRLQLSKDFPLKKARALITHLHKLGIEGVCCSPIFESNSHGYDVTDPNKLNPELGTKRDFDAFIRELKKYKMAYILDIIPNHMGIMGKNRYFADVLKNGEKSKCANIFDIRFDEGGGKIILSQDVNYRRFLHINELIGVRIEDESVLKWHHKWVFELLKSNKVQGLRIDHPDGLYDPSSYLKKIRKKTKGLIWLEKILAFGELLPETWDVDGTVGYDFLGMLNALFVDQKNEKIMSDIYHRFIEKKLDFSQLCIDRKKRYIAFNMQQELAYLSSFLKPIFTRDEILIALTEIFACFPVYRTYMKTGAVVRKKDREYILQGIEEAKKRAMDLNPAIFDWIQDLLLAPEKGGEFTARFQQLMPAVMVKGMEDSALYHYNRLISLNEVGSNPSIFGISKEQFHLFNQSLLAHHPKGALMTSSHDTKFSEDVRMRIHILSSMPKKWALLVHMWKNENQKYKTLINQELCPDLNTEYFIYQLLIGAQPMEKGRIWAALNKAIREMGSHTCWEKINIDYERAVKKFFEAILNGPFYSTFTQFQKEVDHLGKMGSLSALVLKIGSCGIVDIYQGTEWICYSLVDPDNRRPVNFKQSKDEKFFIAEKALNFRKKHKNLFLKGEYIPIKSPDAVIAFMRKWKKEKVIVLGERFFDDQVKGSIALPKGEVFINIFTKEKIQGKIDFEKVFKKYPCAILRKAAADPI